MLSFIRKSKLAKVLAVFLSLSMLTDILNPLSAFALGGGPSQPEVESFEPISTTEMVDLFSGDFTYNIPLIDVGGYPINLSYHSGISADQEASWVGLGWNINPGVINRGMRGIPDDFKGDSIKKEFYIKPSSTYGISGGGDLEFLGLGAPGNANLGITFNTYRGVGMNIGYSGAKTFQPSKSIYSHCLGYDISLGTDGFGIDASYSFAKKIKETEDGDIGRLSKLGLGYNSRTGLTEMSVYSGKTKKEDLANAKDEDYKGRSAVLSFATPNYTPGIEMPMNNFGITFRTTWGLEALGSHPNAQLSGSYSVQKLAKTEQSVEAFGYLYLDSSKKVNKQISDVNRENDNGFNENMPALHLTQLTYDIYAVSGQGIGGYYRPHRGRFGIVSDREVNNRTIADITLPQIELGAAMGVHYGTNISCLYSNTRNGSWLAGNHIDNIFSFEAPENIVGYENVYFKKEGDMSYDSDEELFNNIGGNHPSRIKINELGIAEKNLIVDDASDIDMSTSSYRTYRNCREKRNEVTSFLTAEEAETFGVDKHIKVYSKSSFTDNNSDRMLDYTTINRRYHDDEEEDDVFRKAHHISEMTVTKDDGSRYIYGIPAYNTSQESVTFAIKGEKPDGYAQTNSTKDGLITFSSGVDDKVKNKNGRDEYYSRDSIPGYAHSYLLTAVLSSDYIDSDGTEGPSVGDMGTYVKLNYSRCTNYSWRVPYDAYSENSRDTANYNEGLRSSDMDDRASYIKGEKELWYLHSIETKTHVALFYIDYEDIREDSKEAGDGEKRMSKLDKIEVYSREDYFYNSNPIPIKTVHFEYDYSLCPNIGNRNPEGIYTGKLTLKSLYFTYGNSEKGSLNKYSFSYGNYRDSNGEDVLNSGDPTIINPKYDIKAYDRWGSYQENDPLRPNAVCPYTNQEKESYGGENRYLADKYATAWNLSEIELPTGGIIKIDYEADDYAFVQDKKAMQMFSVEGVQKFIQNDTPSEILYDGNGSSHSDYRNIVVVNIPSYYNFMDYNYGLKDLLKDEKGQVMEYMYFKFLIDIDNKGKDYEYVRGYAKIDYGASWLDKNNHKAYVCLDPVPARNLFHTEMSPLVQAAFNFSMIYTPRIAYGIPDPDNNIIMQLGQAFIATLNSYSELISSQDNIMLNKFQCKKFAPTESYVRLYNPVGVKKGGGTRVKRIRISDEWNSFSPNESNAVYGQEFEYTIDKGLYKISSGVASYEPAIGGDENPFKTPVFFEEKHILAPNTDYYMEEPFGESFFPGASVGYREVKVSSYTNNSQGTSVLGKAGFQVSEFYTYYDFPTKTDKTELTDNGIKRIRSGITNIFSPSATDHVTTSQGFVIELNDMNGKQKKISNFSAGKNIVDYVEFKYKQDDAKTISSKATVVKPDNTIVENAELGLDYDFVVDMRESRTTSGTSTLNLNVDAFPVAVFPVIIPTALPKFKSEDVMFKSVVTTKVINRYGILDEVISYRDGAKVSTKNLAFDSETGAPLLTQTSNEFKDDYYNFSYPAHWIYDGMGQAYKNIGYEKNISVSEGGIITTSEHLFSHGDELMIGNVKYWIYESENDFKIIDKDGIPIAESPEDGYDVKVLRSGRKNIQNLSIGSIVCKKNPVEGNSLVFNASKEIINASIVELTDKAVLPCKCEAFEPYEDSFNPFISGVENNWRKYKEYAYLEQRAYNNNLLADNYNTNTRTDGVYFDFDPFWEYNAAGWETGSDISKWITANEVSQYNRRGMELENINALNIYSSALYGYHSDKMISIVNNAEYREIGFDGFEFFIECEDDHFSIRTESSESLFYINNDNVSGVTDKESHTGKRCIRVKPSQTINMIKQINQQNCQ